MKLNPVEWSQAQELLIKLVQVLTPLAERTVPASFFLSRRFVIPSGLIQDDLQPFLLRHPVRLLTTLHSVQKQVEQWIAEPPKEVEAGENEKGEPVPRETPPLSKQAQKLIDQVQEAIVKLSTSTYVQDPQEVPLREALKKLKPNLDRIIDSMTHEKEPSSRPKAPSHFRHPIPSPYREYVFAKLNPSPDRPIARTIQKEVEVEGKKRRAESPVIERDEMTPPHKKRDVKPRRGEEGSIQEKEPLSEKVPVDTAVEKQSHQQGQKEAKVAPKPLETIALAGAPFLSQTKNIVAPRKKKKRKGFWFKGEDPEEDRNNS